jgi:hypothetical protein
MKILIGVTEPCYCVKRLDFCESALKSHYVLHGCERARRVLRLIVTRGMSLKGARMVVDAAMYGIGCIEGEVRNKIEAQKNKPTSDSSEVG